MQGTTGSPEDAEERSMEFWNDDGKPWNFLSMHQGHVQLKSSRHGLVSADALPCLNTHKTPESILAPISFVEVRKVTSIKFNFLLIMLVQLNLDFFVASISYKKAH